MQARGYYVGGHPGYLQRVELIFGDATAQFGAYQNGEIDVISSVTAPGDIAAIKNDPQLSAEHHTFPAWTDWYVLFHTQDGPFKDLNARKTISHAIDRDAICNGPLRDAAVPGYTVIPPGFPGNQADSEEIRQIQKYDPDMARGSLWPTPDSRMAKASPSLRSGCAAPAVTLSSNSQPRKPFRPCERHPRH